MASTFGKIFKITSFGESHGKAIGGVIDGCPAGIKIDITEIQKHHRDRNQIKLNFYQELWMILL